jgi:D-amino-acid dehydrogenase
MEKITAVITNKEKISCDELVIANGSWLGKISKLLGIKMLMQPGKGYIASFIMGLKEFTIPVYPGR